MAKIVRVQEDDLQDLNLGFAEVPQMVKVSVHVKGQFKTDLSQLLQEFNDIFAWTYIDMKGVDPKFCMQHPSSMYTINVTSLLLTLTNLTLPNYLLIRRHAMY